MSKSDVRVFLGPFLNLDPGFEELPVLFKRYKATNDPLGIFGRDVLYERPPSAVLSELYHVHVIEAPERYNHRKNQFNNTTDRTHLVYCRGYTNPNHYLIIDVLTPDAHVKATHQLILSAIEDAERFRAKY